jgi:hypothetical protein
MAQWLTSTDSACRGMVVGMEPSGMSILVNRSSGHIALNYVIFNSAWR